MRLFASSILFATVSWLVVCLPGCGTAGSGTVEVRTDTTAAVPIGDDSIYKMLHPGMVPLDGSGLRFDGTYRSSRGNVHYLMRFYRQGFAVILNGSDSTPGQEQLRSYIDPRMASVPRSGFHNVPVITQEDSLFIVTSTERGNIDYRGAIVTPDSLSFIKYSHINGARALVGYSFEADK